MTLLQLLDEVTKYERYNKSFDSDDDKKADDFYIVLKKCFNSSYKAAISTYLSPIASDTLTSVGGILYSAFSHKPQKILSITSSGNDYVSYDLAVDKIALPNGIYTIRYSYICDDVDYDDEVLTPPPFTENTLIYLTLSEYHVTTGAYDKAQMYFDKATNILNGTKSPRGKRLKVLPWL